MLTVEIWKHWWRIKERILGMRSQKTGLSLASFLSMMFMLQLISSSHCLLFNERTWESAKCLSSRQVHYKNLRNLSFLIVNWSHNHCLCEKDYRSSVKMVSDQCLDNARSHWYYLGCPSLASAVMKKEQYLIIR